MKKPDATAAIDAEEMEDCHAREGVDPLTEAFDGKVIVHPGGASRAVDAQDMADTYAALEKRPRTGKTAAYIHIPFCETHCLYCGFYRKRYDAAQSRAYADALIAELRMGAETPLQAEGPVHAVYLGGGTPTSLEAPDLKRILIAIKENLPLANDCEITVEGRIQNFGSEKMEACLAGGANRFSLGVQTFDTALRQSMKRMADREHVIASLCGLRSYDEAAVVIDLIYGFPRQTMEMWEEDIRTMESLEIDGADLYQLNIFPGTPLHGAIEKGRLPQGIDTKGRARMYAKGVDMLADARYRRVSVNHWGRTSRERNLYNHMMKSPAHCLAFGPGAGGNLHGYFYFMETDYDAWRNAIMEEKRKPIAMMQRHRSWGILEKTITGELELCRIDFEKIGNQFGLPLANALSPLYGQWARAGLVEPDGRWWELTTAGQFWQVNLAQLTINYLYRTLLKEES